MPCLYSIPVGSEKTEKNDPNSVERIPLEPVPHLWGQSLYIISKLLLEGCLSPSELDPVNRRFSAVKRIQVQVQVAVIAQNETVQQKFSEIGFKIQTEADLGYVRIRPSSMLSELSTQLGKSAKLKLSGRPKKRVGILSTSKVYELCNGDRHYLFYPEFSSTKDFWIVSDVKMLTDR